MKPAMKPNVRWTSALLLPLVAGLSAGAWYLFRAGLHQRHLEAGIPLEQILEARMAGPMVAGMLLGGMLAIATTPWGTAVAGAVLTLAGLLGASFGTEAVFGVALGIGSFGRGMATVSMYGVLARALDGPRVGLRNAAFVALHAGVYFASIVAPALYSRLVVYQAGGTGAPIAAAGSALVVLLLLAGAGVAVAGRTPSGPRPEARIPLLLAAVALATVVSLPHGLSSYAMANALNLEAWMSGLRYTMPVTVTLCGGLLTVVLLVLHVRRVRIPTMLGIGVGLLFAGLGTVVVLMADLDSYLVLNVGLVLGAIGEVLVAPLLLSRISADLPYRLGTLVIAVSLVAGRLPDIARMLLISPRALSWLGVVACLVVGLGTLAAAFPARRIFDPAEPDDEPAPAEF